MLSFPRLSRLAQRCSNRAPKLRGGRSIGARAGVVDLAPKSCLVVASRICKQVYIYTFHRESEPCQHLLTCAKRDAGNIGGGGDRAARPKRKRDAAATAEAILEAARIVFPMTAMTASAFARSRGRPASPACWSTGISARRIACWRAYWRRESIAGGRHLDGVPLWQTKPAYAFRGQACLYTGCSGRADHVRTREWNSGAISV